MLTGLSLRWGVEETQCRICLEDASSSKEHLISPCVCRGSLAHVHASCLQQLYETRGNWPDLTCPTCGHLYEGEVATMLGDIGLARCKTGGREEGAMRMNLGIAYGRVGRMERQLELFEEVLLINETKFGEEHIEVGVSAMNLGAACGNMGDTVRERELLERSLRIHEKVYGRDHCEVARTLANLAKAHGRSGDTAKQLELLERAVALKEKHYGSEHREVAITLKSLGGACGSSGDLQRQRQLLERALTIYEREYGPDHPEVAVARLSLSAAYGALGEVRLQHDMFQKAMATAKRVDFGSAAHSANAFMAMKLWFSVLVLLWSMGRLFLASWH
eukprot:TRINITY_DN55546_c0_g1_i1.p1 TRINITY_DN55546_c0_g1~~TRINITY_DN55546_c0_g1_i1.p1  ORF type:complete len:333 (+),score=55.05 TRINITY_DN55546_c0_g1_i1:81-1079(+)